MLGDLRYAVRSLLRQPTFTAVAVLTLVLGIGTNTAIFSVIKAVLLNQLPYQDPSRLVVVWETNPDGNKDLVAPLTYKDWQAESRSLPSLAAFRQLRYAFAGQGSQGQPLDVPSVRATPNLFTNVLRANAIVGRTFLPEEGEPGQDRVALLSRSFWERHYGGSPSAIGRTIQLDAQPYTIVGVMAAEFDFPPSGSVDVWTPLSFDPNDAHGRSRKARSLSVVGRLADGVSGEQAQRAMTAAASRPATTHSDSKPARGARAICAQEHTVTTVRPALLMISAAVGFLLLIVCANVANLFLARLSSRQTEIAVRAALGAGRWRLARQVIAESVVLAAAGCADGLFVAWARRPVRPRAPEGSLPRMDEIRLDAGVLLFAIGISVFTALVFGLVPAMHAARAGLRDTIHAFSTTARASSRAAAERTGRGRGRARAAAAGRRRPDDAQLRAADARFARLRAAQSPRRPDLPAAGHIPTGGDRLRFYMDALHRVAALPGVQQSAAVSALPMYPVGIDFALPFTIEAGAAGQRAKSRAPTSASPRRATSRR